MNLSPAEAANRVNEPVTVEMLVQRTKRCSGSRQVFLDSEAHYRDPNNLGVVITESGRAKFSEAGIDDPTTHFNGKSIRVRGVVIRKENRPYIEVSDSWKDFHDDLIVEIKRALTPMLPSGYVARTGKRCYIVIAGTNKKRTELKFAEAGEALDPVCGMTVTADATAMPFTHDGVTYYFCCAGCRRTFEANPDAYVKPVLR